MSISNRRDSLWRR